MARKCDITRRKDLTEKVVYGLLLALLVCEGFHKGDHAKAALEAIGSVLPAGCTQAPAFTVGVEAKIASDDDLIPRAAPRTRSKSTTTTTASEPTK